VSPRSSEFLQAARRRLAAAEVAVEKDPSTAEREQADYDAWSAPPEEARRAIELAHRFLTAIEALVN